MLRGYDFVYIWTNGHFITLLHVNAALLTISSWQCPECVILLGAIKGPSANYLNMTAFYDVKSSSECQASGNISTVVVISDIVLSTSSCFQSRGIQLFMNVDQFFVDVKPFLVNDVCV